MVAAIPDETPPEWAVRARAGSDATWGPSARYPVGEPALAEKACETMGPPQEPIDADVVESDGGGVPSPIETS